MRLIFMVSLFMFLIFLLIISIKGTIDIQQENRISFMSQCLQDKKQYECDAMWGQTDESKKVDKMNNALMMGIIAGSIASKK